MNAKATYPQVAAGWGGGGRAAASPPDQAAHCWTSGRGFGMVIRRSLFLTPPGASPRPVTRGESPHTHHINPLETKPFFVNSATTLLPLCYATEWLLLFGSPPISMLTLRATRPAWAYPLTRLL